MLFLWGLTIFVSAFLLFLIQPMFARMALPLLGGAPGVWNTALVFYQGALLAGYAYAHWSSTLLGVRRQRWIHLGLLAAGAAALPIQVARGWTPPVSGNPTGWLILLLATSVGLPFLAVATGSPVLQRWFASTGHPASRDPYFLYAASNAGSLAALLAYPALLEPHLSLREQSTLWGGGYLLLLLLCAACALMLNRAKQEAGAPAGEAPVAAAVKETLTRGRRLRWVLLAAIPASLMTGVTTYLSTEVAALPLLWVVPLGLYLLTFIFAFARRSPLPERLLARGFPMLVIGLALVVAIRATQPVALLLVLHLTVFFVCAAFCHGKLAADRPSAAHLTEFYLWLSLGGVLGGAFNGLLAPVLFSSVAEYPIALVLACMVAPPAESRPQPGFGLRRDVLPAVLLGLGTLAILFAGRAGSLPPALLFGPPALACYFLSRRPMRLGLCVAALLFTASLHPGEEGTPVLSERSFFGVHRITLSADGRYRQLIHGNTLHGKEAVSGRKDPLTYYYPTGPIGDVLTPSRSLRKVAVVGLGAGSLAAYARPGGDWTFYEIDPVVRRIAEDPRYFTFLRDCRARSRIVVGDARLSLVRAERGEYDLIVLDAYSSDSVPLHLMTREALRLYLDKLADGGILAFHISNRHFDLEPVLAALVQAEGLAALVRHDLSIAEDDADRGKTASDWALVARTPAHLEEWSRDIRWQPAALRPGVAAWTDDFASPLPVFNWE